MDDNGTLLTFQASRLDPPTRGKAMDSTARTLFGEFQIAEENNFELCLDTMFVGNYKISQSTIKLQCQRKKHSQSAFTIVLVIVQSP